MNWREQENEELLREVKAITKWKGKMFWFLMVWNAFVSLSCFVAAIVVMVVTGNILYTIAASTCCAVSIVCASAANNIRKDVELTFRRLSQMEKRLKGDNE